MSGRRGQGRLIVAAWVTCALTVLAGCGGDGGSASPGNDATTTPPAPDATQTTDPTETSAPTTAAAEVPELLAFEATTLDGAAFDGRSLAGKPAVFWFWAPWCPRCADEAPNLAAVELEYGDRVAFIGVAGLDTPSAMEAFVAQRGVDGFVHLNDAQGDIYRRFEITVQSSMVFVKADGSTTRVEYEVLGQAELDDRVRALLEG